MSKRSRARAVRRSRAPRAVPAPGVPRHWPAVLLVVLATVAVFWPIASHDFTTWDDDLMISRNPRFNPPTVESALYYWRHPHIDLYMPLTDTAWALTAATTATVAPDGIRTVLEPAPFHLLNLALHVMSVLLVFAILRRLVPAGSGAVAGALLFAVHPVQVEPVSWVSGTKDVLFGLLSFLALWQYLAFAAPHSGARRGVHYAIATTAFVLAMLAKPTAMVVPALAAVVDGLLLRRPWKRIGVALTPWFGLALACAVVTKISQPALELTDPAPLWLRPLVATDAVAFYLYKLILPVSLGIDYGRTPRWILDHGWAFVTWILPAAVAGLLWWKRAAWPVIGAGALLFVIGLSPLLGLVPFDFQQYSTVADHYLYLPMLGAALALAGLVSRLPAKRVAVWGGITGVLLVARTWTQTAYWNDTFTLFEHAIAVNPDSGAAHNNLAAAYVEAGDLERAIPLARRAIALRPRDSLSLLTLGAALVQQGQPEPALESYRRAVALAPDDARGLSSLSALLGMLGRAEEALPYARRAVAARPDYPEAHLSLGTVLVLVDQLPEAETELRRALALDPGDVRAHANLGSVLLELNRRDEARRSYETALRIDPTFVQAQQGLAALDRPAAPLFK